MRITKVELKNFKRFTDLTIDGIPADAKLVLLIGSNGSGKSSVFDAFEIDNSRRRISPFSSSTGANKRVFDEQKARDLGQRLREHKKLPLAVSDPDVKITTTLRPKYLDGTFIDEAPLVNYPDYPRSIEDTSQLIHYYGRTSFRHVARLTEIKPFFGDLKIDENRPKSFVDRDNRFSDDIGFITRRLVTEIFRENFSTKEVRERYINPINESLERVLDSQVATRLNFLEIIPPGEGEPAELTFTKGESEISYDNLSAGEKEVFNIIFNLFARKDQYTDTVYFFDELDLHLNTRLQFNLLKEITENWLPDNCQLWTASHSLGFIDYAQQYDKGVIIDFDDFDFDQPQTLFPQSKERLDVYDIAVPKEMLFEIMKGKKVVVCENKNDEFYNLLGIPDTIFVGVDGSRDVFLTIKRNQAFNSMRDRDFISDTEINRIEKQYPNHHILRYYNFENYLYHPDNLTELNLGGFDRETYVAAITAFKRARYDYILPTLISSRQNYEEFKTNQKLKDENTDAIVDDFKSDDFERFYKYFNMKSQHEKIDPSLGRLTHKRLVQTKWFRQQIEAVLNR